MSYKELTKLREILVFNAGAGHFKKAEYPWLRLVRIVMQAGSGGYSSDGNPGQPGQSCVQVIRVDEIPDEMFWSVGKGGKGGISKLGVGKSGEDGYILMELYDTELLVS